MLENSLIRKIFENLQCPKCLSKYEPGSFYAMRLDDGLFVFKVVCKKCSKSFGVAFLGLNSEEFKNSISKYSEPPTITYDDVLDAHKYIQNLDENWKNFINGIQK